MLPVLLLNGFVEKRLTRKSSELTSALRKGHYHKLTHYNSFVNFNSSNTVSTVYSIEQNKLGLFD